MFFELRQEVKRRRRAYRPFHLLRRPLLQLPFVLLLLFNLVAVFSSIFRPSIFLVIIVLIFIERHCNISTEEATIVIPRRECLSPPWRRRWRGTEEATIVIPRRESLSPPWRRRWRGQCTSFHATDYIVMFFDLRQKVKRRRRACRPFHALLRPLLQLPIVLLVLFHLVAVFSSIFWTSIFLVIIVLIFIERLHKLRQETGRLLILPILHINADLSPDDTMSSWW